MPKYHLTNKAVSDLNYIWNYTCDFWSEQQAEFYYEMIIDSFQEIIDSPEKGKNYSNIVNEIRGYLIKKHIVFYRLMDNHDIEIVRILHSQMDLKNRMKE